MSTNNAMAVQNIAAQQSTSGFIGVQASQTNFGALEKLDAYAHRVRSKMLAKAEVLEFISAQLNLDLFAQDASAMYFEIAMRAAITELEKHG